MMCEESHDAFKSLTYVRCPFCDYELRVTNTVYSTCCDNPNIRLDDSVRRCINCYWFEYPYVKEFMAGYRIVRKSIYIRKYQFMKIVNKYMSGVLMWDEKLMLYEIFVILQSYITYVKRSIKFSYLIRKIFELKGDVSYRCFPLPKSLPTMIKYEHITHSALVMLSYNKLFVSFKRRN